jgi:uncharacterized RDD family membrane protein YckC
MLQMQQTYPDTDIKDSNLSSLDAEIFIPIDPDWRNKYYKKVLRNRLFAFVIDYFTILLIASIPAWLISFRIGKSIALIIALAGIFQFFLFIVLCAKMESSKWQSTFGKRIMKIQITDDYGNSISFSQSIKRNLLRIVVGYSYLFIIPFLYQISNYKKTKKLFHDQLSHTIIGERF